MHAFPNWRHVFFYSCRCLSYSLIHMIFQKMFLEYRTHVRLSRAYITVRAPLSAALNKSRTPKENMLTFTFYFIFELKLHQKLW